MSMSPIGIETTRQDTVRRCNEAPVGFNPKCVCRKDPRVVLRFMGRDSTDTALTGKRAESPD